MFVPTSTVQEWVAAVSSAAAPTNSQPPPDPVPTSGGGGHTPLPNWDPYVLNVVFPVLGVVLANIMAASPLPEFFAIFQAKKLHPIDPFPVVIMFASALHTFVYAVAVQNAYLFISNAPAVLIQAFCMMALFRAQDFPEDKIKTATGVILASIALLLANLGLYYVVQVPWGQQLLGITFNVYQYTFFLFPLVQLATVFKERNAAILVPHLVFAVTINGFIWSIFGLTLQDWFVAGPNIAATIVGGLQVICILFYGRRSGGQKKKATRDSGRRDYQSIPAGEDGDDSEQAPSSSARND